MKFLFSICFVIFCESFCFAQNDGKGISDSLALESRTKADMVLSKFDTLSGNIILYTLRDKHYYIVFQLKDGYKEYVLEVDDTCNIVNIKKLNLDKRIEETKSKRRCSENDKRLLKRLEKYRQIRNDAFDTSQYCIGFVTVIPPNATHVGGVRSYFVMKDRDGKRYGEFCLPSWTFPCQINPSLWVFLHKNVIGDIDYD